MILLTAIFASACSSSGDVKNVFDSVDSFYEADTTTTETSSESQ